MKNPNIYWSLAMCQELLEELRIQRREAKEKRLQSSLSPLNSYSSREKEINE